MSNSSSTTKKYGTAPIFKGATKQIEDHIFYFGTGMQQKFRESAKKLLSYAGRTYGVSTQMSIELGTTTIAEMDKPSYTFTDDEFYKKSYHEKRMINDDYDDWKKAKQKVRDGFVSRIVCYVCCLDGTMSSKVTSEDQERYRVCGDAKTMCNETMDHCQACLSRIREYEQLSHDSHGIHVQFPSHQRRQI